MKTYFISPQGLQKLVSINQNWQTRKKCELSQNDPTDQTFISLNPLKTNWIGCILPLTEHNININIKHKLVIQIKINV